MNFTIIHKQLEDEGYVEIENFLVLIKLLKLKIYK